jgi:anti-anti-sigma factor
MTSDELRARRLRKQTGIADSSTARAPVIRVHRGADIIEVTVSGELGLYASTVCDEVLVDIPNASVVIVDCTEVDAMDPAFLSVIGRHWKRLHDSGGRLEIRNPSEAARRTVQLSGLEHILMGER